MTDRLPIIPSTTRRTFLGGSLAAALAWSVAQDAVADDTPLRAAVLEHLDPWTNALGLGELLRRAGVEVIDLDVTRPADQQAQPVDLIAFGTFTNNARPYLDYAAQQATSLRTFVSAGGVVLDMAQSDQFSSTVAYLPTDMRATRTDVDYDTVFAQDLEHPLVAGLRTVNGQVFTGRDTTPVRTSYETLGEWDAMRVLLACTAVGSPPCLLEGAHGRGRFLVSSLSVDKCFDTSGGTVQPADAVADSQTFFTAVAAYVRMVRAGTAPDVIPTTERAAGPMVGHTTSRDALIWLRPGADHQQLTDWTCTVQGPAGSPVTVATTISPDNDFTMIFSVTGLRAATGYEFSIRPTDTSVRFQPLTGSFTTAPADNRRTKITMGLGSCAPDGADKIWDRVVAEGCDSFVMLGDTPYIDSTNLAVARQKHRDFLKGPKLAAMASSMPVWGTWDDHDFGGNDVHGDLAGKRNNRTAFVDYRAHASYGETADGAVLTDRRSSGEGVYTSFRRGPVEVFLLDPRWFSRTAPSWADPTKVTALGEAQWEWLQKGLRRSTATFKVVLSGMIWDDKQNSESDDWGTYAHERDAIFAFIRSNRIPGVLLLSGDIHVSRALNYGVSKVGYDLWQFIVSPMHYSTIASLNVPNPALVHSAVEPNVFMKLQADTTVTPATLKAEWINGDGRRIFEVSTDADAMVPQPAWVQVLDAGLDELIPGEATQVTTSFTNNTGRAVSKVTMELDLPAGWTASATTAATFASVAGDDTVSTTWSVVPAADGAAGAATFSASATYTAAGRTATVSDEAKGTVLAAGTIPSSRLRVAGVSSEQSGEGAARAIDGNPATFWHTRWSTSPVPAYPHWINIDTGASHDVDGMTYLPRQDGPNGRMKDYQVFVSTDGQNWGSPVATGSFTAGTAATKVTFTATRGRYVRLVGLNSQNGGVWGGAGEITLHGRRI